MTTTENSRADALTEAQRKALETAVNVLNINWEHETANELWEAFTAPSLQPAAAPIDDKLERPARVGGRNYVAGELKQQVLGRAYAEYDRWVHSASACKRCGSTTAQACNDVGCFYLESGDGEPAPSPADERAAFEAHLIDTYGVVQDDDPATERAKRDWTAGWQAARAASANETGAEGAKPVAVVRVGSLPHGPFNFDTTPHGVDTLPSGVHQLYLESRSPAMAAEAQEPVAWLGRGNYYTKSKKTAERLGYLMPVYTGPQPSTIPAGWMLVPKHRGTKPLAELIIAASLACVENRLMEDDDRHELAQFADQLQRSPQQSPATNERSWTRKEIDGLLDDADRLSMHPGKAAGTIFDCARVIREFITTPQPAQADARVGLTDEQVKAVAEEHWSSCRYVDDECIYEFGHEDLMGFARAIFEGANQ